MTVIDKTVHKYCNGRKTFSLKVTKARDQNKQYAETVL